jgi:hypothetical protein
MSDRAEACAREPKGGARPHALEDNKPGTSLVVNDLDVAYVQIPEAEREWWCERADRALEAAGMPDWMRITPTVKAAAVRMWCGWNDSREVFLHPPLMAHAG